MPEIRKNKITGELVIMAPERAKRPSDIAAKLSAPPMAPEHSESCPLCPGNEAMTPPETYRVAQHGEDGPWGVRVIPNKFSALSPEGDMWWKSDGLKTSINGIGLHEVMVENNRHNTCIALMEDKEVKNIIRTWHHRFHVFHKDPRIEQIIIFKNHGVGAGTSLEHPHSQIVGLPIIPAQIRYRSEEAYHYFIDHGKCLLCATLEEELSVGSRVILDTENFVAFIPYAALSPFHTWIFPKRHSGSFGAASRSEIDELAIVIKTVLLRLYKGLNNPDLNISVRTSMPHESEARHLHWYITIIPRVTKTAGFELGTGMRINPSLPENSAEFLRSVEI